MECPRCGLVNLPQASRCECGYDFVTGRLDQSGLSRTPKETQQGTSVAKDVKILAALLITGGIAGLLLSAISISAAALLALPVFGWCAWKGVDLWKAKQQGYSWGKILFACQIPVVSVPEVSYQFFTGMAFRLTTDLNDVFFAMKFGATFTLGSGQNQWLLGVNLLGVIGLVQLIRAARQKNQ